MAIELDGKASLGGVLELTLLDEFVPKVGQQFVILTAGTRSGVFSGVNRVNFPANLEANPTYSPTAVTVTITSND